MIERLKNWILPLLFGSSVAYMIIKCYHNADAFKITAAFFAYALVCFVLFDIFRKVKRLSGILYVITFAAVAALTLRTVLLAGYNGNAGMSFSLWFYGAQTEDTYIPSYSFGLIFGGGFFLISILYYFTQVIYRAFGTMLIMFFPLFIYAKRLDHIAVSDFIIVLIFYLSVLVHNRQMKSEKNSVVIFNGSYVASIGIFVLCVAASTMLIPKPDVVSVQENDTSFFDNLVNYSVADDFSSQSSISGGRLSNEIWFTVESENPMYLKRQSYDYYKDGVWHFDTSSGDVFSFPEYPYNYVKNTTNYSTIEIMYQDYLTQKANMPFDYPELDFEIPEAQTVTITCADGIQQYYPLLPLNTVSIEDYDYSRTYHGEFRPVLNARTHKVFTEYSFDYYPVTAELEEFCSKLTLDYEENREIINEYSIRVNTDTVGFQKYVDIYGEAYFADELFTINSNSDTFESIDRLALEITAGLSSPYEKAKALEGYFEEENFEYDGDYVSYTSTIEDFVFENKKGACGDFATAMTLMAKAAGLRARYTEGFVVTEKDETRENTYIVREYHSHAFVEVFIPGAGWMIFDPTVDGYLDYYDSFNEKGIKDYVVAALKILAIPFALAVVFFVFRKQIFELVFRIRVNAVSNSNAVIMCYNRLLKLFSKRTGKDLKCLSTVEASKTMAECDIYAEDFVRLFEKTCYSHYEPTADEKILAVTEYKRVKRAIMKLRR